ncbi:hypothetical protein K402DRAFT_338941 [Aulographum hederae CBS 113979]|uniref:Effector 5 n=1 Tax=Aulographum hederae CBS 113979 TaxID=1176131 RepID=A0A6G1GQG7_9PEZI|nr:hypothetical protein K402DRAFT_338941 [Aulographum hederae CBS 113979]
MRFSTAVLLAAATISEATAWNPPHRHAIRHAHTHKRAEPALEIPSSLHPVSHSHMTRLGAKPGVNPTTSSAPVWLGADGPYVNDFENVSGEPLILVIWGPQGSWINAVQPHISISMPNGSSQPVSFADGASGAWSTIYPDTAMVNGQISETWGEFTFGQWGVVDVSREVNMEGHSMSIIGPKCTSDMSQCVFRCIEGTTCLTGYELHNCENGSQDGANYGTYAGAPSGGCGGMGESATIKTLLG